MDFSIFSTKVCEKKNILNGVKPFKLIIAVVFKAIKTISCKIHTV